MLRALKDLQLVGLWKVKGAEGGVTCEEGADAAEVEGEAEALRFAAAAGQADDLLKLRRR